MNKPANSSISLRLLLLLSAIFMLSPFAIDIYLPAVQLMAIDLEVPSSVVAITISLYAFGTAFGQLVGGTLSDVFGRKLVMIGGLLIFSVCSLFLSNADSAFDLIFWRIVQSLGGGIAVVGVPAIIRDYASGKEATRLFALITLFVLIAPIIAPILSTLILQFFTWEWIFYILAVFPLGLIVSILILVPHSIRKSFENPVKNFTLILKEKKALGFLIAQIFAFASYLTFITNSSIIYIEYFHISKEMFTVLFVLIFLGVMFANRLNVFLLKKHESKDLLQFFLAILLLASFSALVVTIIFPTNIFILTVCIMFSIGSHGGIIANSNTCFLSFFKEHAGVASGMLGATQYLLSGIISGVSTVVYFTSIVPIFIIMVSCSSIAVYGVVHSKMQKTV